LADAGQDLVVGEAFEDCLAVSGAAALGIGLCGAVLLVVDEEQALDLPGCG
jgi:hypothetical protein